MDTDQPSLRDALLKDGLSDEQVSRIIETVEILSSPTVTDDSLNRAVWMLRTELETVLLLLEKLFGAVDEEIPKSLTQLQEKIVAVLDALREESGDLGTRMATLDSKLSGAIGGLSTKTDEAENQLSLLNSKAEAASDALLRLGDGLSEIDERLSAVNNRLSNDVQGLRREHWVGVFIIIVIVVLALILPRVF